MDAPTKHPNGKETDETYAACQETCPASWFSTNPVHCLRSKYLHKHSPPCHYYHPGKEHLLEVNEKIGCFYHAAKCMESRSDMAFVKEGFTSSFEAVSSAAPLRMF